MPETKAHAPGSFCWIELGTSDQNAAKTFYEGLFGWSANDVPMGPGETYTMFSRAGASAGAAYRSGEGVFWNLYIATDDADATARRAAELGGRVVKAPFDVFDAGRMAVLADPTGAAFCVWQAARQKGLEAVGGANALCWADLSTPDVERARTFYTGLFGWKMLADEHDPSGYLHIWNGEAGIGGVQTAEQRNPHAPPHWLIYFETADCAASVERARELGARIHMGPLVLPHVGTFAVMADPQGATLALFEPPPPEPSHA